MSAFLIGWGGFLIFLISEINEYKTYPELLKKENIVFTIVLLSIFLIIALFGTLYVMLVILEKMQKHNEPNLHKDFTALRKCMLKKGKCVDGEVLRVEEDRLVVKYRADGLDSYRLVSSRKILLKKYSISKLIEGFNNLKVKVYMLPSECSFSEEEKVSISNVTNNLNCCIQELAYVDEVEFEKRLKGFEIDHDYDIKCFKTVKI